MGDAFREVSQDSTSQLLDLNNRNSISLGGRYKGFKEEWLNFLKQLKTHISMSFKFDGWYEQTLGWIWIHEDEVVDNEVVYLVEICDDDKNGLLSLDEIEKHYKILLQLEDTNYGVFIAYNAMKKRFDEES